MFSIQTDQSTEQIFGCVLREDSTRNVLGWSQCVGSVVAQGNTSLMILFYAILSLWITNAMAGPALLVLIMARHLQP